MKINTRQIELLIANQQRSYKEFCAKAGITERTLKQARNGNEIRPETAGRIAAALGVRVEDFVL